MPSYLQVALFTAAFKAAFVIAQDAPTCMSKPDHSNYGKNGDSWCQWDSTHFWKPEGVGCKTDAECQGVKFPYTNCHDVDSIEADSLLASGGVMFCDYSNGHSGQTECTLGAWVPANHAGAQGSSGGGSSSSGGAAAPVTGAYLVQLCRDYISKLGYTDVNIAAACTPPGANHQEQVQCIFQCNGGTSCGDKANPKAYHKFYSDLPTCPGYESATYRV
ncbi:hypothetical protein CERZMDRAFT_97971 [Cercospora zeae-maydis SCOH1-5]|uniref:Secreted protein n=1 Tax=Cercospora zeae-maydis SCOH1-5 TaxID=717836 RepID=A0A6A6FF71_9PEZI|nr:hypothetical protein CERZMDRAFT_97971 [Cercospora zeae-maydis SCOH1-5]